MEDLLPWMGETDVKLIAGFLPNKPFIEVLEWGVGGSTVYFSKMLEREGVDYRWVGVEYNKEWFDKIQEVVSDKVELKLFDSGSTKLHPDFDFSEYIAYPSTLGRRFDFILVDGRCRRRCLIEASRLLAPRGVVVLHDANREWYKEGMAQFKYGLKVSEKVWVGFQD